MIAMIAALVIVASLYFWLQHKEVKIQSNDVWRSVWENIVNKGLKKINANTEENSSWNPNIILFSGRSEHQSYLLELSKTVSGRIGIVTNFKLIVDKDNNKAIKKTDQVVSDNIFSDLGIFARQIKVDNIYTDTKNIAATFGFSGVEPNTIIMGWPKGSEDSKEYAEMTEALLHLDYNLLYLDFDKKTKFGDYKTVDLWWRETDSKNAEMMLNIARFIIASPRWHETNIQVLFVNNNNVDSVIIYTKIAKLVEDLRVNIKIEIIDKVVQQIAFYNLIKQYSDITDLTLVGIPNYKIEQQAEFIVKTNQLFETIGSTLLVKAANNFNVLDFDFIKDKS